jgi:photosystem II stability/assembly factor-like uncharacterized protein
MSAELWRRATAVGSLLLVCSLGFGAWTQQTSGTSTNLNAVHFPEGTQVGYAVGFAGTILKTTDGGSSWVAESSHTGNALNSVYFKDNNTGFAVGARGAVVSTTDGGTTWTATTVGTDPLNYVRFPSNGQVGYIGVGPSATAAKVLKTTDGGANWTPITVGGVADWSTSCAFVTDSQGLVVGKAGMVYGTTNGLDSAGVQEPNTGANMVAAALSPTNPNKGYLVGNDSNGAVVRYTTAFGQPAWDSVVCPPVTALYGVDMPASDTAYFCGDSGFIGVSASSIVIWKTTTSVSVRIRGLCFPAGADTGYAVGFAGTILKTTDAGAPWGAVAEGKSPAARPAGVRILSNPCRHGIYLQSDAAVRVVVFDAAGRAVRSQDAAKGTSFLPLEAGAYFLRAGTQTTRAVVTD